MFCLENGINCNEIIEMLEKAFGEISMSTFRIYELYKLFKEVHGDDIRWPFATTNESESLVQYFSF